MSSSTFLVFIASLAIFISASNAIPPCVIHQICAEAINRRACLVLLWSDPKILKADMKGVEAIVLDILTSKASETKSILPSLAAKATDPTLKKRYDDCANFYGNAIGNIGEAKQALARNDNLTVIRRVWAADKAVGDCVHSFSTPPKDPSDLGTRSKDLTDALNVALIISKSL